jgi:hypothetical protein
VSFKDALELAVQKGDPRESKIRERVNQLESTMPKLVITVSPNAPSDLEIRQDGDIVARVVWGSPVPIDPGVHTLSVKAYGRKPWIGNVQIAPQATIFEVKIPDLVSDSPASGPAPIPAAPPPAAPATTPAPTAAPPPQQAMPAAQPAAQQPTPPPAQAPAPPAEKSSPGSTQRVLGWTSVALGAVGLGVGTVFMLQRKSKLDDRAQICPEFENCTQDQVDQNSSLTDEARTASTIGTIGFVAGGVLAATGLVLVITAPSSHSKESVAVAPVVGPGFQGVSLAGRL